MSNQSKSIKQQAKLAKQQTAKMCLGMGVNFHFFVYLASNNTPYTHICIELHKIKKEVITDCLKQHISHQICGEEFQMGIFEQIISHTRRLIWGS